MISLPSININGLPINTLISVINSLQIYKEKKITGKIIIHTGINKQNRRVYAVETRKIIREDLTNV